MAIKAVSDTGPVLHLYQIASMPALAVFSPVAVADEVEKELGKYEVSMPAFIKVMQLSQKSKDFARLIILQFELDLGEAESIALFRQESAKVFFTDDLDAREAAKQLGIAVHGTMGILLRAFRLGKMGKAATIQKLRSLGNCGMFITSELIEGAVEAVEDYKS